MGCNGARIATATDAAQLERAAFYGTAATAADVDLLERVAFYMEEDASFVEAVDAFLLEHCGKFGHPSERRCDGDELKEYPLEYQTIHARYIRLVERLLEQLLTSLGTTSEGFVDTLRRCGATEQGKRGQAILRTIDATSDFDDFLGLVHDAKLMGSGCFAS